MHISPVDNERQNISIIPHTIPLWLYCRFYKNTKALFAVGGTGEDPICRWKEFPLFQREKSCLFRDICKAQ